MIPQQEIKIIPKKQYQKIVNTMENVYESWAVDQDEKRKKYYLSAFKIMKKEIIDLLKSDNFWNLYAISSNYCDFIFQDGPRKGMRCGSKINIKCINKKGVYRCYNHISKTIYESEKRKNIDPELLCIGFTRYNSHIKPCKNLKWKNNYCQKHFRSINNPNINQAYFEYYFNKLLYEDIKEDINTYIKECLFIKEINILFNINYYVDNTDIKYNIDIKDNIEIKFNNSICCSNNCYNNLYIGEDFCKECLYNIYDEDDSVEFVYDDQKLDEIIKYIDKDIEELDIIKNDNIAFNNRCNNIINISCKNNKENKNINELIKIIDNQINYEIITNIIDNKTYINITYLEKILNNYNLKIKDLKKELEIDFPIYYKKIKGYLDILEQDIELNIIQKIKIAKINSIFL